jgi:hypothetical protein
MLEPTLAVAVEVMEKDIMLLQTIVAMVVLE